MELLAADGMVGDLLQDSWKVQSHREKHFDHVMEVVGSWTRTRSKSELFELGQAMRLPWAPVCTPDEVVVNPQLTSRRFFRHVHSSSGKHGAPVPGPPYRFRSISSRPCATTRSRAGGSFHCEASAEEVLRGIRVLDFTWMLAGPYATRILADAGAEVIKVQSRKTAKDGEDNSTGYFATWNRNKRSITLDLDHEEARRIVRDMAAKSDVIVESFSPRVMENWLLTYEALAAAKPDLIMASISAMGHTGPWRDYVGYGPTFHALSGLNRLMSKGLETPLSLGHAYGDTIIGLYAALAVLAALRLREATGQGQYIDLSGYEAVCSILGPALFRGAARGPIGPRDPDLQGCYQCRGKDRWCTIAPSNEAEWQALSSVIGTPSDGPFSTPIDEARQTELREAISRWTARHSSEQAVRLLQRAGVPAGIVQNADDLARDRQLVGSGFFVTLQHPTLGATVSDRTPLFFERPEPANWRPAPLLGEANDYVFKGLLGMSDEEFGSYVERGIIG